jgi:pectate lyase
MRSRLLAVAALCSLGLVGAGGTSASATGNPVDLGHQVLPANDGWASATTGTTGGSAADAAHVFHVTNRTELVQALGGDNKSNGANATPKIILVDGTVAGNVDDANQPLDCAAYQDPAFTLAAYLAAFDPAVWGRQKVSGPLEDARSRSEKNQAARVQIRVGPNTTIVGVGQHARMVGLNLLIQSVDNVIVRNLEFQNAADCFPQWDPTDGANGNWNSAFDNVSLVGATHVWVDHDGFNDGDQPDSQEPLLFGRPFQVHDGELDITKASDLATVEWSAFREHGKTMLIGSSDTATGDVGKLRVTVHHNLFDGVEERAPRVRFGQVHVFNNLYVIRDPATYVYSWGVGVQSQTFAENNFFATDPTVTPDKFITVFSGTAIHATGTLVNGFAPGNAVDVVAAYNAKHGTAIGTDVGWTPTLFRRIDRTQAVPLLVGLLAGPGRIGGDATG